MILLLSPQSTLRISPPLPPYLMSSMQKERLSSRLEHQDSCSPLTPPSSTSPGSALSRRWPTGSLWPGLDLLEQPDETFSIEREARLHRQAAGKLDFNGRNFIKHNLGQKGKLPRFIINHIVSEVLVSLLL